MAHTLHKTTQENADIAYINSSSGVRNRDPDTWVAEDRRHLRPRDH